MHSHVAVLHKCMHSMHFCKVWKGQFIANMLTCCQQGARNLSQHEITVTRGRTCLTVERNTAVRERTAAPTASSQRLV